MSESRTHMPLQTFEHQAPSLFRQSASPLTRLAVAGAVSVFLMVSDSRFQVGNQMRAALATVLAPVQWISAQPVKAVNLLGGYVTTVEAAKQSKEQAAMLVAQQSLKAQQAESLSRENEHLRQLLDLQQKMPINARAAEVVYIAPDPFTRKVIVNKGSTQGVVAGAAVIDEFGLLGQVVRVFPLSSEVSIIDNPDQATPILNSRTGERGLAYGDSQTPKGGALEVRFLASNADFQVGDMLMTSGVGGMYPAGLPVGTVAMADKRNNSAFARVQVTTAARPLALGYVLVLDVPAPVTTDATPAPQAAAGKGGKGGKPRAAARGGRK